MYLCQCVTVCFINWIGLVGRSIAIQKILHKNINAVYTIELINHIIFKYLNYKSISNGSLKVAWLAVEPNPNSVHFFVANAVYLSLTRLSTSGLRGRRFIMSASGPS